jgi:DNA-binding NtrC family response regulator
MLGADARVSAEAIRVSIERTGVSRHDAAEMLGISHQRLRRLVGIDVVRP